MESDKVMSKIDFEIQSHIKEYHPTNYHCEYELLQKKDESYKMELSKRTNTKWNKIKEINFRNQEIRKLGRVD